MNLSNAPFCNLYNRKCDFSPLRAAWRPDFFVMGLCSPFALRYAGRLQAGTQDSWCLLPRAALRACLPVQGWRFCAHAGLPRRSAGVCSAWPQVWRVRAAARVAAQLRPRSATATVRRRIWLAPWAKLSMRTISMDLTMNGRGALMAQRPHQQSRPDGLRHVCARAARQRAAPRLAAAIVHVAHDCIANPYDRQHGSVPDAPAAGQLAAQRHAAADGRSSRGRYGHRAIYGSPQG